MHVALPDLIKSRPAQRLSRAAGGIPTALYADQIGQTAKKIVPMAGLAVGRRTKEIRHHAAIQLQLPEGLSKCFRRKPSCDVNHSTQLDQYKNKELPLSLPPAAIMASMTRSHDWVAVPTENLSTSIVTVPMCAARQTSTLEKNGDNAKLKKNNDFTGDLWFDMISQ